MKELIRVLIRVCIDYKSFYYDKAARPMRDRETFIVCIGHMDDLCMYDLKVKWKRTKNE